MTDIKTQTLNPGRIFNFEIYTSGRDGTYIKTSMCYAKDTLLDNMIYNSTFYFKQGTDVIRTHHS